MNGSTSSLFAYTPKGGNDTKSHLPDPYVMYSTVQMPRSISDILKLCEHIWLTSGQYKMAMQRIGRYFLTKVVFDDVSDTEKKKYDEFFNGTLNIMSVLAELVDDFMCYGNSFASLYMPFNRIVICDKCNLLRNIAKIPDDKIKFDMKAMKFDIECPRCEEKTHHTHKDTRSNDEDRINIIRWNIHEMQMMHDFMSGKTDYIWNVSADLKKNIKDGNVFWLKTTPFEVIEAIAKDGVFRFNDDVVFHMKEPTISGVQNRGWGIPRMLAAYKDIWYIQMLKRYNEALALDYIVPFRLLTPSKATAADPLMQYDMSNWSSKMQEMLVQHRRDPAGWHTAPFPVTYQTLGGEGQQMSPHMLLKQGTADMNDSLGVPVEMYQGTMSLQAAPTAIRLFESTWPHVQAQLNGFLNWLIKNVSQTFGWEEAKAKLQTPTYADNLERKQMIFQLQSAQQISKQTAFASLGIDPEEEQRRIIEENRFQQETQREFEEEEAKKQEMQETMAQMSAPPPQQQMGGAPVDPNTGMPMDPAMAQGGGGGMVQPMGGMPGMTMPGQGSMATTPQELMQQAEEVANQLMAMPETARKSELINLKRSNPVLHAQVKQIMTDMTQQAASQGVSQMRQQAQQGGGM